MRGDLAIKKKLEGLGEMQAYFCINPIVLCELFKGAFGAERQHEAISFLEDFINSFEFLEFREDACKLVGEKHAELKRKGKQTQGMDLMIGCIALAHDATLVTRNPKDFVNIKGLKILAI